MACDHGVELLQVVADEGRLEDEVLGRVAGERQLGEAARCRRPGRARRPIQSTIRRELPDRSPTIGLIWASAIRNDAVHSFNCRRSSRVSYAFASARELLRTTARALQGAPHARCASASTPTPSASRAAPPARCATAARSCARPRSTSAASSRTARSGSSTGPTAGRRCWSCATRRPTTPFLFDAKRGDMGNTMRAYARAVFGTLAMDAATVNPYLGADSLEEFTRYEDRGVYVVCRISNPGAADLQHLEARRQAALPARRGAGRDAQRARQRRPGRRRDGAGRRSPRCDAVTDLPFLIPGVGAQGGDLEASVRAAWNGDPASCLVVVEPQHPVRGQPGARSGSAERARSTRSSERCA